MGTVVAPLVGIDGDADVRQGDAMYVDVEDGRRYGRGKSSTDEARMSSISGAVQCRRSKRVRKAWLSSCLAPSITGARSGPLFEPQVGTNARKEHLKSR